LTSKAFVDKDDPKITSSFMREGEREGEGVRRGKEGMERKSI
jgi:hypothetical protein